MIVGGAPLPLSMQGVFWLTGQEDSSALMSFGGPSNDGGGMSTGVVTGDRRYSVRVSGDRTWAFATNTKPIYMAGILDLIYHFILNDDKAPTKCQVRSARLQLSLALAVTVLSPRVYGFIHPEFHWRYCHNAVALSQSSWIHLPPLLAPTARCVLADLPRGA